MVAVWPAVEARRRGSAAGQPGSNGGWAGDWRRGEYPHGISKGGGVGGGSWWVGCATARYPPTGVVEVAAGLVCRRARRNLIRLGGGGAAGRGSGRSGRGWGSRGGREAEEDGTDREDEAVVHMLYLWDPRYEFTFIFTTGSRAYGGGGLSLDRTLSGEPSFLVCSPFCERFSQVDPFWKDFKKWTLSSAPWIMAPRLRASAPQIMAPRSWA
jgi:hypothetical protein